jgi:hypothetical protein
MPEIITIIWDCYPPFEASMCDPLRVGEGRRCTDAQDALYRFLTDHHISWYERDVTRDEMSAEEERLIALGAKDCESI